MQSKDLYQHEYLENTGDWHVADSPWKAGLIFNLYQRNQLRPQIIAEAGCGAGAVLEELLKLDTGIKSATGFDISPVAIELAMKRRNDRLQFVEGKVQVGEKADLLLMIDVLEHVEDYYGFLKELSSAGRSFIFHIPLDLSCRSLLKPRVLLQQRRSVGHLHYFSEDMIWWLLQDTGFHVVDYIYTKPAIDTKPAKGAKQRLKKLLRRASYSLNASMSRKLWGGYSLLILATHGRE